MNLKYVILVVLEKRNDANVMIFLPVEIVMISNKYS